MQSEVDGLAATLKQVELYNEQMKGEIAVTRRYCFQQTQNGSTNSLSYLDLSTEKSFSFLCNAAESSCASCNCILSVVEHAVSQACSSFCTYVFVVRPLQPLCPLGCSIVS